MIDMLQVLTLLGLAMAVLLLALAVRRLQSEIRQMRNGEFLISTPTNSHSSDIIERINCLQDTLHRASRTPINVAKAKA
ncbi:hypothetical protein ACP4J4_01795 [Aureimonas ureilytica]|uniref:hypothetical protein n=1 Tax=Aureimonas ureilytica TaxID=401562 RepID=UPI003CE7C97B